MIAPALVDGKPLSHPSLDRVWAAFAHHGISPVFHVADQPKVFDEAWYTRPRRARRLRRRQRVALRARGARLHGPDPERRARAPSRPAPRHRRALRRLGAALPDDARRRQPVRAAPQRPRHEALAASERLLQAPGPRVVLRLRAARADPAPARRRRAADVLQRLPALRGHGAAARGLRRAWQARASSPTAHRACSTTTPRSCCGRASGCPDLPGSPISSCWARRAAARPLSAATSSATRGLFLAARSPITSRGSIATRPAPSSSGTIWIATSGHFGSRAPCRGRGVGSYLFCPT